MVKMRIIIEIIPHSHQRYPTVGDWHWENNGDLNIKVSQLKNWRYEALVGVHELVESLLCRHYGITEDEVTNFDIAYEAQRKDDNTSEPGDDKLAPYRLEHFLATNIERCFSYLLGVDWSKYEEAVNSL